jgi:hypothetical protein
MKRNGVSHLSITIITMAFLVILVAIVAILFAGFLVIRGVNAEVKVKMYAPQQNIGVLNDEALFSVFIRNDLSLNKTIEVIIEADGSVVNNTTITVEANTSKNTTITQKLVSLGKWRINVIDENDKSIGSYSFLVVLNEGEANVRINQWNDIQFSKNLSIISLILASISLVIQFFSIKSTRRPKHKKEEKT